MKILIPILFLLASCGDIMHSRLIVVEFADGTTFQCMSSPSTVKQFSFRKRGVYVRCASGQRVFGPHSVRTVYEVIENE